VRWIIETTAAGMPESGCEVCVYDVCAEQLEAYPQALAAWKARHPEATERPA